MNISTQWMFSVYKSKLALFFVIFVICCQFLMSCTEIEMNDLSSDPKYSQVIGKKFILKEDVLALGISSDNSLPANYIVLISGVGFSGPEVVSRSKMRKGTVIQVVKVLVAESLISSKVAYVVKETESSQINGKEIRITLVDKVDDSNYGLDGNYYKIVN